MAQIEWSLVEGILCSPLLWGFICLVTTAIALSGRLDVNGAKWVLAAAWLMAIVSIYRFEPFLRQPLVPRILLVAVSSAIVGIGLYYLAVWMSGQPQDQIPWIQAQLRIESLDENGEFIFKVQLENGDTTVKNVRLDLASDNFRRSALGTEGDTIAPKGKLSIPGSAFPVQIGTLDELALSIYYDANISRKLKHFTASYSFPLTGKISVSQVIDPSASSFKEDVQPHRMSPSTLKDDLDTLNNPEGSLVLRRPEAIDGKPSMHGYKTDGRGFFFDGAAREVWFKTTTQSGRVVFLQQPFKKTRNGDHLVQMTWSEKGGSLTVDGVKKRDYDP